MFLIAITTLFVAVSADSTQVLSVAKPEHPVNYTEFNHTVYANNVGVDELVKLNEIIRQQRALPFGGVIPRLNNTRRPRRHIDDDSESSYDRQSSARYAQDGRRFGSADEEFASRMSRPGYRRSHQLTSREQSLPFNRYFGGLQNFNLSGNAFVEMFNRFQSNLYDMLCVSTTADRHIYARMANSIETSIAQLDRIRRNMAEYIAFRPRNVDMCE